MRYRRQYDLSRLINLKEVKVHPPFALFTIISTWFYIGLINMMPGTFGSIASYPIYWFIIHEAKNLREVISYFWTASVIIFLLGMWSITKYQKITNTYDHASIVIDEVFGMLITFGIGFESAYSLAKQLNIPDIKTSNVAFMIIFLVFRIYDVTKPLFIKIIDKNLKNAFGVMLDDAVAGLYAALTIIITDGICTILTKYSNMIPNM
jgi:phosphatidylglycerophosphatase A